MLVAAVNANNYYSWGIDINSLNSSKYSNQWNAKNPVWTNSGGQYDFETFMGGEPTHMSGVTVSGSAQATELLNCTINGDATYNTANSCNVGGGVTAGIPAPGPAVYPISDAQITEWEEAAANGEVLNGDYTVNNGAVATIGPTKINGNLTADNNATLYIAGPVWVDGDIILGNNVRVILSDSLGNAGTVIIVGSNASSTQNGKISISNNAIINGNGQAGSYPLLISMYSGSGYAVDLNNNAANTIFFAPYGTILINNNAGVKEVTAHQIILNNNARVEYESGLQSAHFSNGPGGSWKFQAGSFTIVK